MQRVHALRVVGRLCVTACVEYRERVRCSDLHQERGATVVADTSHHEPPLEFEIRGGVPIAAVADLYAIPISTRPGFVGEAIDARDIKNSGLSDATITTHASTLAMKPRMKPPTTAHIADSSWLAELTFDCRTAARRAAVIERDEGSQDIWGLSPAEPDWRLRLWAATAG